MLNTPGELFITNWKMKKAVFFLLFVSYGLENYKEKWGPCACLGFVGPSENVHFLDVFSHFQ